MQHPIKTVGIIAEYNPFHNGHRYQIEELRHRFGAENIVVVMSGEFLQRGTPAVTDKYLRTNMALSCGADIVFELPAVFSTASAETFAFGGISLLQQLGFVDTVCFGSECGDVAPLSRIADFLHRETEEYSAKLRRLVSAGASYPAARNQILAGYFPDIFESFPDLLTSPNNILAIEYLKALRRLDSRIQPITIPRSDHGYHSNSANNNYISATAIRSLLREHSAFSDYVPEEVSALLNENISHYPVTEDDFSEYLYYALLTLDDNTAPALSDMSAELWHRICRERTDFHDFSSFADRLKSKQYTHSRISRVLCHILLNIRKDYLKNPASQQNIPALYGRILGIRAEKSALLRSVTHFPLINKLADARHILEKYSAEIVPTANDWEAKEKIQDEVLSLANAHLQVDLNAAALYRRALYCKTGTVLPDEHRAGIILHKI